MKKITKRYLRFIVLLYVVCIGYLCVVSLWHKNNENRYNKQIDKVYNNIENLGEKFVFENDSLVFWQTNSIPIDKKVLIDGKFVQLKNGLYLRKSEKKDNITTVWLYLVKSSYPITNQYINNSYNKPFASIDQKEFSKQEKFIFYCLLIVSVFCTGVFLISLIKKRPKNKIISLAILSPIYIMYVFMVYKLCSYNSEISFRLYANKIIYSNVLSFMIMLGVGFWIYMLTIKLLRINKRGKFFIVKKIVIVLFISVICGFTMEFFSHIALKNRVEEKAKSLSIHRNQETESNFVNKILELESNEEFSRLIEERKYTQAEEFITETYFSDIADMFHIGALVFNDMDSMLIQPGNYFVNILSYTEGRIESARRIDSAMCWVEDSEIDDNGTYIYFCKSDDANIFVECLKKKNSRNRNYSLILSEDEDELNENISYARYYKGNLIYSVGEKNFAPNDIINNEGWQNEEKYLSYIYKTNDNLYIVSLPYRLPYDILGAISLFFLCLIILLGLEYIIRNLRKHGYKTPSFRNSILITLSLAFVTGIVISGIFSVRNIKSFNNKNNTDILKEKTLSIRLELEKYFIDNGNKENIDNKVLELSNAFMTDINIFDTNGVLIATSQRDIFEGGYLLDRMNNEAKHNLQNKSSNMISLQENIGKRKFMAAYSPINDLNEKTVCYLNIPFISQQKSLDDNINSMINGFLNMFLFWINISVILFLIISDYITKPLRTLKEKLNKININDKNDKIVWENNDEIGELIESYNLMVDKIEESSYLLKQQERQSSWRELAKQVAHDIKNPLTPMKLSIQYLQKIYEEKPSLFEEKFKTISPSLISQIESISNIASELNTYSKPMDLKKEKTDLVKCIKDAINLFNSEDNVSINYTENNTESIFVSGDEKLFVRIFNNLFKNSCQAFYEQDEGHICISSEIIDDYCIVSIKDDGCGISEENKSKIFNTHFSTKTEGSGIGLTIVKTIIESYGGSINFVSKEGEGTTFFVKFKLFE
ncbi:MAG: GHKL domain-containing protein [Bacteroidales bacterium]|nr:GHKL domain-containing protein [Bacteroidales bacterium]